MFKTRLAHENWSSKYQWADETPIGTFQRIARAMVEPEAEEKREHWYEKFLRCMVRFEEAEDFPVNGWALGIDYLIDEGYLRPIGIKASPGGRITSNAGTGLKGATLLNCFINGPVKSAKIIYRRQVPGTDTFIDNTITTEDTPDNLPNIMLTLLEQAETLKSEGGYGLDFSWIRPRSATIHGVGIKHPGVVAYMTIWDRVSEVIVKGDNDGYVDLLRNYLLTEDEQEELRRVMKRKMKKSIRKGAMMATLRVDHPDIEEFIRAKQTSGVLTKFNISVIITDEFMEAVKNDALFDLRFNGVVYKRVKARELYELIMQNTYNRAEPGVLFEGNMQRNNPLAYLGPVLATNPCGEIPGNPDISTVCLLGSLNLTQYVRIDRTFDFEAYIEDIKVFARMLDNVNDVSVVPLPQYTWALKNIRQYGMGVNGLGSTLFMMGLGYDTPEAREFTEKICWLKEEHTWRTSAELAAEKGPFPAYSEKFLETYWFTEWTTISPETKELIRRHGVRNAKTSTNPPLGNSSVICDNVSNGIEPVFDYGYERTVVCQTWPAGLTRENVTTLLKEIKVGDATAWKGEYQGTTYYYEPHNRGLCFIEPVRDYGYQWVMDNYPADIMGTAEGAYDVASDSFPVFEPGKRASYLVTTNSLKVEDHVAMQAVVQRHCNQSVSKTCNLPNDYPYEDFKALYMNAWKAGLNGFTTYRDGCMEAVLTKLEKSEVMMEGEERQVLKDGLKLPETFLNGPGEKWVREGRKFYSFFSYHPDDAQMKHPIALWLITNNKGGELAAVKKAIRKLEAMLREFEIAEHLIEDQLEKIKGDDAHDQLARMVGMCLRHCLPITRIIMTMENIDGDWAGSALTAVRKMLSSKVADGTKIVGKECPQCSSTNLVFESGCSKCRDCGCSNCG